MSKTTNSFLPEVLPRAVRLVLDHEGEHPSWWAAVMVGDMDENITALERAFQLATSGKCASVKGIRVTLAAEGYPREQLTGSSLTKQLRELIRSSQGSRRATER